MWKPWRSTTASATASSWTRASTVLPGHPRTLSDWAPRLGEDHLLDLKVLGQVGDTAMTSDRAIEMQPTACLIPFVPGRNLLFLTLAAALGYRRQLDVLVGGMCETDFSGYP